MSFKAKKQDMPPDPDPLPTVRSETDSDVVGAARAEKKRLARMNGRNRTILAGDTASANGAKKTILGG